MQERLLHFIWQHKLFNTKALQTTQGMPLRILDFGKYNNDGGPDFWNAKIEIDGLILVGNIELHVAASDWRLHKHQEDRKYDNVILHVVYFDDETTTILPTLELNGRIPPILLDRYTKMLSSGQSLICQPVSKNLDECTLEKWKERLLIERLERKSGEIQHRLYTANNDWEQVFYQLLGKYFGSHINKEPFELLTKYIDYKILLKHTNNLFQLEALLFGTAGFLDKDFTEPYPLKLKQEYNFLKHKYQLKQLQEHQWQFLRMRPVSFPSIRIAWFAKIVQQFPLFQKVLQDKGAYSFLDTIEVSEYWKEHYLPDKLSKHKRKTIGEDFKSVLKVNVFVPLLHAYGRYYEEEKRTEKALHLLSKTAAEVNSKTRLFEAAGFEQTTAHDTQAFTELYDRYCSKKRCLECSIGHKILQGDKATASANKM